MKTIAIKQQHKQCRCTLGGVICTGFTLVKKECSSVGFSVVELQDENQTKQLYVLLKWCRRNVADSSTIYSHVLRTTFWLHFAAALHREPKLRSLNSSILLLHLAVDFQTYCKSGSCFILPVTLKTNNTLHVFKGVVFIFPDGIMWFHMESNSDLILKMHAVPR